MLILNKTVVSPTEEIIIDTVDEPTGNSIYIFFPSQPGETDPNEAMCGGMIASFPVGSFGGELFGIPPYPEIGTYRMGLYNLTGEVYTLLDEKPFIVSTSSLKLDKQVYVPGEPIILVDVIQRGNPNDGVLIYDLTNGDLLGGVSGESNIGMDLTSVSWNVPFANGHQYTLLETTENGICENAPDTYAVCRARPEIVGEFRFYYGGGLFTVTPAVLGFGATVRVTDVQTEEYYSLYTPLQKAGNLPPVRTATYAELIANPDLFTDDLATGGYYPGEYSIVSSLDTCVGQGYDDIKTCPEFVAEKTFMVLAAPIVTVTTGGINPEKFKDKD